MRKLKIMNINKKVKGKKHCFELYAVFQQQELFARFERIFATNNLLIKMPGYSLN
jgi:hypothetical protein